MEGRPDIQPPKVETSSTPAPSSSGTRLGDCKEIIKKQDTKSIVEEYFRSNSEFNHCSNDEEQSNSDNDSENLDDYRVCRVCGIMKPITSYYERRDNESRQDKHYKACKMCHKIRKDSNCNDAKKPVGRPKTVDIADDIRKEIRELFSKEIQPSKKSVMQKYKITYYALKKILEDEA